MKQPNTYKKEIVAAAKKPNIATLLYLCPIYDAVVGEGGKTLSNREKKWEHVHCPMHFEGQPPCHIGRSHSNYISKVAFVVICGEFRRSFQKK